MSSREIIIRAESRDDVASIGRAISAAFLAAPHTSHTEEFIVDALRQAGKLYVSRVALHDDAVVGHVAISPVKVSGDDVRWFGLGPFSVLPTYQRRGIGSALIMDALLSLSSAGAVPVGTAAWVTLAPGADNGRLTKVPSDVVNCAAVGNIQVPRNADGDVDVVNAETEFRNQTVGLGGDNALETSAPPGAPAEAIACVGAYRATDGTARTMRACTAWGARTCR